MAQSDRSPHAISPPPFPDGLDSGPVTLRRFSASDADCLVEAGTDADILSFTSLDQLATADEVDHWLERRGKEDADGTALALAITEDGEALGAALVLRSDLAEASAEVGYWLLPRGRGRGLATYALLGLRDWCASAGFQRLSLVTNLDNVATQRVARRCGFQAEGVLRSYGFDRYGRREDVLGFSYVVPGCEATR
ncbi:GNAT family N-acetyltransferase [Nocardioides currus]|uniref:N-acetyltransferase domain-containing protein n=1 Tax=Nocardioides currus TaxID=2133958 RepID=A0A2R7YTV8_9ACTN|nr:GNAT family N-acetyltransferase [Nocardioides currus]PUA79299.1 hypothetical protein C7S10_19960 [Nocardioides currus]